MESGKEIVTNDLLKIKLTPKQKAFLDNYSITNDRKESGLKAGYSAKGLHVTTTRLLQTSKAKAYLEKRGEIVREMLSNSLKAECYTKEYALKELQSIIDSSEEKTADRLTAHAGKCKILGFYKPEGVQNVSIFANIKKSDPNNIVYSDVNSTTN